MFSRKNCKKLQFCAFFDNKSLLPWTYTLKYLKRIIFNNRENNIKRKRMRYIYN